MRYSWIMLQVRSPSPLPPRFPGLNLDARQTLVSSEMLLTFSFQHQIMQFLIACDEQVDLSFFLKETVFFKVRSTKTKVKILLRLPMPSADRASVFADYARLFGGQVYIGLRSLFIRFRDATSPFGYDVGEQFTLPTIPDETLHLYDVQHDFTLTLETPIDPLQLMLKAHLTPRPLEQDGTSQVTILADRGLERWLRLWARQRQLQLTLTRLSQQQQMKDDSPHVFSAFSGEIRNSYIRFLSGLPGVEVTTPLNEHVVVSMPYAPSLSFAGLAPLFESSPMFQKSTPSHQHSILIHLQKGAQGETRHTVYQRHSHAVDLHILELTRSQDDVSVNIDGPQARPVQLQPVDGLPLTPEIRPTYQHLQSPQALLIPLDRLKWLLKILYALPSVLMRNYRLGMTNTHILIWSTDTISGIPLGCPYVQVARNLFLPVGFELFPRFENDVWVNFFQLSEQHAIFYIADELTIGRNKKLDGEFLRVDLSVLKPLSRTRLSHQIDDLNWMLLAEEFDIPEIAAPSLGEGDVSTFALWRGDRASEIQHPSRLLTHAKSNTSALDTRTEAKHDRE